MSTLVKRTIETIGWILLMTLVYVAVITGLVIRGFQNDDTDSV